MRVLIAPDKFKGTLTAEAAARAMARGWRAARPRDTIELLPISDGGDGFGRILGAALGARSRRVRTVDAAGRPWTAQWWWEPATRTAIIESASIIGLARLPQGRFHPFALDTFGLGAALRAAARQGARQCFTGIGGSATNDGGFGLARALGWEFLSRSGGVITRWTDLSALAEVVPPKTPPPIPRLIVAVDVQNPLLGANGCTRVYGPQKGLRPADFPRAEAALRSLAGQLRQLTGRDLARQPGAGAAGGLGFGLGAFAGARLQPGFDLIARHAGLNAALRRADLVITGEGSLDASSLMGKGVGEIATRCQALGVPCLGLAGRVGATKALRRRFTAAHGTLELVAEEAALNRPAASLARLARHVAVRWKD